MGFAILSVWDFGGQQGEQEGENTAGQKEIPPFRRTAELEICSRFC
jgi:hypothetical protein